MAKMNRDATEVGEAKLNNPLMVKTELNNSQGAVLTVAWYEAKLNNP